jgi:hypothetical protein
MEALQEEYGRTGLPPGFPPLIPPSEEGKRVSEEEYWENYYEYPDVQYEWNDGYLEAKPVSDYETYLSYQWMTELLGHYLRTHPAAKMVGLEFGFRIPLPIKTVIRKADLGVVRNDNPVPLNREDHSYGGIFDLCIEALSDLKKEDIERDTVHKKAEYQGGGVKEYYIIDGTGRETAFYARDNAGMYQHIIPVNGDIIRSRVLPGFQFRISDLYRQPSPEEMAEDEVYRGFVMRSYQAEKQRAEKERQKAEREKQKAEKLEKGLIKEKQRAEREKKRAEREKQRLEKEQQKAEREKQKAKKVQKKAKELEKRLTDEQQKAEQERQRAERLAEKLRELGISFE